MTTPPLQYDGLRGLEPREHATPAVLSLGMKRAALEHWQRDHPGYQIPADFKNAPVLFTDLPRAALFIKAGAGIPPAGKKSPRVIDRYRTLLAGFERFNLNEDGEPWGQQEFHGLLPAGPLEWSDPEEKTRIRAPWFQRQRQAQKLELVYLDGRKKKRRRGSTYSPPMDRLPPGNMAECRGDGNFATRWNYQKLEWEEIPCLGDKGCPFAEVCPPDFQLMLHSREQYAGESTYLRLESKAANSLANLEGFLRRIRRELDTFGLDGELYGFPIRVQVEIKSAAAGVVRGVQLDARRFPVLKFSEQGSVIDHKATMLKMIQAAKRTYALPPAQSVAMTPEERQLSDADFDVTTPEKPRQLLPADHALKIGEEGAAVLVKLVYHARSRGDVEGADLEIVERYSGAPKGTPLQDLTRGQAGAVKAALADLKARPEESIEGEIIDHDEAGASPPPSTSEAAGAFSHGGDHEPETSEGDPRRSGRPDDPEPQRPASAEGRTSTAPPEGSEGGAAEPAEPEAAGAGAAGAPTGAGEGQGRQPEGAAIEADRSGAAADAGLGSPGADREPGEGGGDLEPEAELIGTEGRAELTKLYRKLKPRSGPPIFPTGGLIAALAESGAAPGKVPEDLTEDERSKLEKWMRQRASLAKAK